jgi:hypothetical protein
VNIGEVDKIRVFLSTNETAIVFFCTDLWPDVQDLTGFIWNGSCFQPGQVMFCSRWSGLAD